MSRTRQKPETRAGRNAADARYRRLARGRLKVARREARLTDETDAEVVEEVAAFHGDEPERVGALDEVSGEVVGAVLEEADEGLEEPKGGD